MRRPSTAYKCYTPGSRIAPKKWIDLTGCSEISTSCLRSNFLFPSRLIARILKQFIELAKKIYSNSSPVKSVLYYSSHKSEVVSSFTRILRETIDPKSSEDLKTLLPSYLQLLQVCLLSKYNQKEASERNLEECLIAMIVDHSRFDQATRFYAATSFSLLSDYDIVINKAI